MVCAAGIAADAHPFVMLVTHQHEPGFAVLGENNRFAAGNVGDVANLFVEIPRRELTHGWTPYRSPYYPDFLCKKMALTRRPPRTATQGCPSRLALSAMFSVMPQPGKTIRPQGMTESSWSLRRNGAALACRFQSCLKQCSRRCPSREGSGASAGTLSAPAGPHSSRLPFSSGADAPNGLRSAQGHDLNARTGMRRRPGAAEVMRRFRIGSEVYEEGAPDLQAALANAYARTQRPLCLCREPGCPMYIARLGDLHLIKRMPLSGGGHDPSCDSYESPYELSGLGALMGSAIQLDPQSGLAALKLDFSLSKTGSRAPSVPAGHSAASVT